MKHLYSESLFLPYLSTDRLHIKRMFSTSDSPAVLMIHGSIENGRIFYSKDLSKGLGPYLARNGFDVYIPDLRGRGRSTPKISSGSNFGQTETIVHELPFLVKEISKRKNMQPLHFVAHSWGGVMLASTFARCPKLHPLYRSLSFFGTKRVIHSRSFEGFMKFTLLYTHFSKVLTSLFGYLPAKKLKFGADNEPKKYTHQVAHWAHNVPWIDQDDGYNYAAKIKKYPLPPLLSITGSRDIFLGNPTDVKLFVQEINGPILSFKEIGKNTGYKEDYDHITLLTHPNAHNDHFPLVLNFIQKVSQSS